eukprot:309571-Pleurochrysis_carterae.AAC.1
MACEGAASTSSDGTCTLLWLPMIPVRDTMDARSVTWQVRPGLSVLDRLQATAAVYQMPLGKHSLLRHQLPLRTCHLAALVPDRQLPS